MSHTKHKTVHFSDTATAFGSGMVEVFATPAMIAMMENTCFELVQPHLQKGTTTVETSVDIRHIKATL